MYYVGKNAVRGPRKIEFGGGTAILVAAEERQDYVLLRRIKGYIMYACEAQYHPSCRKRYTTVPKLWQSPNEENRFAHENMEAAHKEAYAQVWLLVDKKLIEKNWYC